MRNILKTNTKKRRVAAVVLGTLMLVNIFGAAAEKSSAIVTVNCDGYKTTYETYASTVGDFLTNEDITVKDNDYINYTGDDEIVDGMEIVYNIAKYVTVNDNGETYGAVTYAATVDDVMAEFDAALGDDDVVTPTRDTRAYDGLVINVDRSVPVTFVDGDVSATINTRSKTVGEFLEEIKVELEENQMVSPSASSVIKKGMRIEIHTVKSVVSNYSAEGGSKSTNSSTSKSSKNAMSSLNYNADLSKAKVLICEATAYTAAADECGPYADGRTATGAICQVGVVAVDPSVIPLGTKLYIESVDGSYVYGYCVAADTGGAIKGNKVDLAMNSKSECFQFGRRQVRVYIIED
ncbi:MAG: ubiquitin-like domain-containing protein [Clostridia bacterium]